MKKSSKILGSVALSAALVMGTAAPAFADQPNGVNVPTDRTTDDWTLSNNSVDLTNDKADGASTVVTVSTYTSQLNVTVPLYLPVWLDTSGAANGAVVPTPGAYFIENSSPIDITVSTATYKNSGTAGLQIGTNLAVDNTYNLSLTPQAGTGADYNNSAKVFSMSNQGANTAAVGASLNWKIAKGSDTNGDNKMGMTVAAQSGKIDHSISNATLATIVYTVSAGTENVAPTDGKGGTYVPPVTTPANPAQAIAAASMAVSDVKALFGASVKIVDNSGTDLTVQDTDNVKISKVERWLTTGQTESDAEDVSTSDKAPITSSYSYKVTCAIV